MTGVQTCALPIWGGGMKVEKKVVELIIIWILQVWHWSQDIIKLTRNSKDSEWYIIVIKKLESQLLKMESTKHSEVETFAMCFEGELTFFFFLINNGIVLIKSSGTPGVYMDNSTSNT